MKKYVVNILATTGLSLIILSFVALMFNAELLEITTVFETFGANVFIHISLIFTHNAEFKYGAILPALDVGVIILILIVCGAVFDWFVSTPIWVLMIMGSVVYQMSAALNLFHMHKEANEINELLKKHNEKKGVDT